ncbi:EAL domain-containing protein [Salmonella enterica]|nr:EAL domain-containing protein [Salmonella enterica]
MVLILEQGQSDRDLIKCVELRLSDAGMEFALGYFGSGCSALSYLKYFPSSYIKMENPQVGLGINSGG